jgi:hypothetical protein
MVETFRSRFGVPVRITDERWAHVTEEHPEMAGLRLDVVEAIVDPERIVKGGDGEWLALRALEPGKLVVAVYRETGDDGFLITAFLTRRTAWLERREQVWPR